MTPKHLLLAKRGPVIGLAGYETGMGQQLQNLKSWNILVQKAQHCGEPDQSGATTSLLGPPGDNLPWGQAAWLHHHVSVSSPLGSQKDM